MLKPASRVKIALRPPPKSSVPLRPHRSAPSLPLVSAYWCPPFAFVLYVRPASAMPYNTTLDCADAEPAIANVPMPINFLNIRSPNLDVVAVVKLLPHFHCGQILLRRSMVCGKRGAEYAGGAQTG